jgi:hypothetical protein
MTIDGKFDAGSTAFCGWQPGWCSADAPTSADQEGHEEECPYEQRSNGMRVAS